MRESDRQFVILRLRALIFYVLYAGLTAVWGAACTCLAWALPYRARFTVVIGWWTRWVLWLLKVCCGVRHRVSGSEHIPDRPCIVLCRHESTWETLFLQTVFAPQATLIKRELLWIPCFGWAFALLRPIAIKRGEGRRALRQLVTDGTRRLEDGVWVVLFPEGTRLPPGQPGGFQPGGAALAAAAGAPILPIVHNAGAFWPAHHLAKHPGTVDVHILPPIDTTGLKTKEINQRIQAAMAAELDRIYRRAMTSPGTGAEVSSGPVVPARSVTRPD